jgi:hypothetical protein
MNISHCTIEMTREEVLRIRIPSKPFRGIPLPDAVFTFRVGDPQYDDWRARYEAAIKRSIDGNSRKEASVTSVAAYMS